MRELVRQGVCWHVREMDSRNIPGARGASCLIFDSDGAVRRVWTFPATWDELSDDELWGLLESAGRMPHTTPSSVMAMRLTPGGDHPAVAAATAGAARARSLLMELGIVREKSRSLIQEQRQMLAQSARIRMDMRTAIESYASTLRREGVAPEQALVLIKTAMEDGLGGRNGRDEPGADELVRDGVVWAITAYYAA